MSRGIFDHQLDVHFSCINFFDPPCTDLVGVILLMTLKYLT